MNRTGPRAVALVRAAENGLLTAVLLLMMALPLLEALLRKLFRTGIPGLLLFVPHLTLVVSVIGAAVAARENRLLALSTLPTFLPPAGKRVAAVVSNAVAAAVSFFLCVASVAFVRDAGADPREVLIWGVRTRWLQWLLPVGFGLIAVRLLKHAALDRRSGLCAIALFLLLVGLGFGSPWPPASLRWWALGLLLVATVLGAPVFSTLGGAALILFWSAGEPISAVPTTQYSLVVNQSLPAIPLFTLAGYFLAEGGASKRLMNVFDAVFGHVRGGPAIVTVLVCAFFTSFTGGSGVTILALGGLLMPVLLAARYSERDALGLLTGAGSLGLLFPPCLPLILYAIISTQAKAPVSIEAMFLGGLLPGLLMVALAFGWGIRVGPPAGERRRQFDWRAALHAVRVAKWELLLPVVALGALFGGFATTVEAAALTALYAFVIETFVYGDLALRRDVPRVVTECGLLIGGILLILGVALGFTNYLVDAEVPARLVEWMTSAVQSRALFLLLLNLFLIGVGCLMDIYSAIVVVVPLIVRLGREFGVDPIHLGIIFLANLELGYLTPPVGMNLFVASYRFGKPLTVVTRAALPMLGVFAIGVVLITYFPPLTTWLPHWLGQ